MALGSFLDTFQKIADAATNTKGQCPLKIILSLSDNISQPKKILNLRQRNIVNLSSAGWICLTFHCLGATREIGACLTRIVIRHKAMEARMKTLSR